MIFNKKDSSHFITLISLLCVFFKWPASKCIFCSFAKCEINLMSVVVMLGDVVICRVVRALML